MDVGNARPESEEATICQLARLGDLAQTLPLMKRLGDCRATLICDKAAEQWARQLPGVHDILSLDTQSWRAACTDNFGDLSGLFERLRGDVSRFSGDHGKRFFALNDHPAANALAVFACLDDARRWVTRNLVLMRSYVRLIASLHLWNRIHLADLWASLTHDGVPMQVPPILASKAAIQFAKTILGDSKSGRDQRICAVILGSGSPHRRIEPEAFAEWFAALPAQIRPEIVLLGGGGQQELAGRFLDGVRTRVSGVVNLAGKCSPEELVGVLAAVDLVLGVDTGPLHWAALAGTQALGLYFGEAGFHDTGPYGDGHLVLAPDCPQYPCSPQKARTCGWRCRQAYQNICAMADLLAAILQKQSAATLPVMPGLKLHASRLTPSGNEYRACGQANESDEFEPCAHLARRSLGLSSSGQSDALLDSDNRPVRENLELFYQVWKSEIEQLRFPAAVPRLVQDEAKNQAVRQLTEAREAFGFHEYPAAKRRIFSAEPAAIGA